MAKKIVFTEAGQAEITRIQQASGVSRKTAIRKMRAAAKVQAKAQAKQAKAAKVAPVPDYKQAAANDRPEPTKPQTDAGKARSEGIALFKLAGRPSREDFVKVYGPTGPRLTWPQRAALGVDAAHFQAALKAGKCVAPVSRPAAAKPAPTATAAPSVRVAGA
jgi:hypothetical protein